jgi:adenylyltransferase/sulfurtransferase
MQDASSAMNRYHRQILLPQIGLSGQQRLAEAHVLLVGCGALGSVIADQLVRSGVGHLTIVDRDLVELTNLQRQVLFDEADAAVQAPKAVAAARRLQQINSTVRIEPLVRDVHAGNIEDLTPKPIDLVLDGTDNVQTRYLLNDFAVKHNFPWVYGGCVAAEGRMLAVLPGRTGCLRCIFPDMPQAAGIPTCDTVGPAAAAVGALQALAAIQILSGHPEAAAQGLVAINFWPLRVRVLSASAPRADCPCCGKRVFEFLDNPANIPAVALCGHNAVQVRPANPRAAVDLPAMRQRWTGLGQVEATPYLVRCQLKDPAGIVITLFADARAIIHGTADPGRGRSIYARFVGM